MLEQQIEQDHDDQRDDEDADAEAADADVAHTGRVAFEHGERSVALRLGSPDPQRKAVEQNKQPERNNDRIEYRRVRHRPQDEAL